MGLESPCRLQPFAHWLLEPLPQGQLDLQEAESIPGAEVRWVREERMRAAADSVSADLGEASVELPRARALISKSFLA